MIIQNGEKDIIDATKEMKGVMALFTVPVAYTLQKHRVPHDVEISGERVAENKVNKQLGSGEVTVLFPICWDKTLNLLNYLKDSPWHRLSQSGQISQIQIYVHRQIFYILYRWQVVLTKLEKKVFFEFLLLILFCN